MPAPSASWCSDGKKNRSVRQPKWKWPPWAIRELGFVKMTLDCLDFQRIEIFCCPFARFDFGMHRERPMHACGGTCLERREYLLFTANEFPASVHETRKLTLSGRIRTRDIVGVRLFDRTHARNLEASTEECTLDGVLHCASALLDLADLLGKCFSCGSARSVDTFDE